MFQAELWFRGLVSRPRSVACYRPRRQRSRQGSADATGRGRARGVFYLLSALCITNHHPPANRPAQARCPRLGLRLCAPPRRAKSSTNPPWSALSQPPGSACGGHYIDHPHQRPEGRFSAIHGEGGSLDCEISPWPILPSANLPNPGRDALIWVQVSRRRFCLAMRNFGVFPFF